MAGCSPALARRVAHEPAAGSDQVGVGECGYHCADQAAARPRVSVERDHDVAARRLEALLERPRLADPAGREGAARDDLRGARACDLRRPVARAVVDDDRLEDVGVAAQRLQARPDPRRLVARRDDDAGRSGRRTGDGQGRHPAAAARQPDGHGGGSRELRVPQHFVELILV
jgi:hypothetical protein